MKEFFEKHKAAVIGFGILVVIGIVLTLITHTPATPGKDQPRVIQERLNQ